MDATALKLKMKTTKSIMMVIASVGNRCTAGTQGHRGWLTNKSFFSFIYLSLNVVNGPALGVAVRAIVLIINFHDRSVDFIFNLETVKKGKHYCSIRYKDNI